MKPVESPTGWILDPVGFGMYGGKTVVSVTSDHAWFLWADKLGGGGEEFREFKEVRQRRARLVISDDETRVVHCEWVVDVRRAGAHPYRSSESTTASPEFKHHLEWAFRLTGLGPREVIIEHEGAHQPKTFTFAQICKWLYDFPIPERIRISPTNHSWKTCGELFATWGIATQYMVVHAKPKTTLAELFPDREWYLDDGASTPTPAPKHQPIDKLPPWLFAKEPASSAELNHAAAKWIDLNLVPSADQHTTHSRHAYHACPFNVSFALQTLPDSSILLKRTNY